MRLIDADKLIKDGWHLERSGRSNRTLSVMSIADVPTAYDPEKVVEQLEELISYNQERSRMYDGHTHYDSEIMGISRAIEIVKGGTE